MLRRNRAQRCGAESARAKGTGPRRRRARALCRVGACQGCSAGPNGAADVASAPFRLCVASASRADVASAPFRLCVAAASRAGRDGDRLGPVAVMAPEHREGAVLVRDGVAEQLERQGGPHERVRPERRRMVQAAVLAKEECARVERVQQLPAPDGVLPCIRMRRGRLSA